MAQQNQPPKGIQGIQLDDLIEGERYLVHRDIAPYCVAGLYRGIERGVGGRGQVAFEMTGGRYHRIPVCRIVAIKRPGGTIETGIEPAEQPHDPGDGPPPNVRIAE